MMRYVILLTGIVSAAAVYGTGYTKYTLLLYLFCALILLVGIVVIVRGRLRDVTIVVASLLLPLIVVEGYLLFQAETWARQTQKIPFTPDPVLGWSPIAPGVFRSKKIDSKSGKVIFDVNQTIDEHLQRKTVSNEYGPTIAFFGDSFTFGEGLQDSETLPQTFSNVESRDLRILNFGITGYGPQQFLRAMETDIFRERLNNSQLFVFLSAPWHAERTSCLNPSMLRSPKYVIEDGKVVYKGACADGLIRIFREMSGNSAAYRALFSPTFSTLHRADIELYVAVVVRAVELAREKYGVPTLIMYLPFVPEYLSHTGYTDADIMEKFRAAGAFVLDATINSADYPRTEFFIPGDGHPTGAANRLWAEMLRDWIKRNGQGLLNSEVKAFTRGPAVHPLDAPK